MITIEWRNSVDTTLTKWCRLLQVIRHQENRNWGKSIKYMTINLQKVSRYKRQGLRNCNWKRFKEAWQMQHGILDCILEYRKALSGNTGEILWKFLIRLLIFYSCKFHFDNCTMAISSVNIKASWVKSV